MARLTKLEDNVLVKRVRDEGDQFAFGALMEKYRKPIFFTILKMVNNREDADDLTLECFTKAYKNIHKYDDSYAFSTWIFKIASNGAIDFIRKKRIETTSIDRKIGGEDG
ncbi:MAG: sigma-70 family RNA polymerase sigma factor, partial [Bacteroidota bacterium]|nr:sigma-70 family RNA polymerase sigma factor [Bacteroidota bacterium]